MKTLPLTFLVAIIAPVSVFAQVANPVADFKTGLTIPSGDKIQKWEVDVDGDGKPETFLSLKSDFDNEMKNHEPPGWHIYFSRAQGADYWKSTGTEEAPGELGVGDIPTIDPEACFVGQIAELGKRGIITMRIDNPREGESIGKIYAYTIDGDHLKRTELAQYVVVQGPHALFAKYLAADKRTQVQLQEITP
jgi:hypothetical protein